MTGLAIDGGGAIPDRLTIITDSNAIAGTMAEVTNRSLIVNNKAGRAIHMVDTTAGICMTGGACQLYATS